MNMVPDPTCPYCDSDDLRPVFGMLRCADCGSYQEADDLDETPTRPIRTKFKSNMYKEEGA